MTDTIETTMHPDFPRWYSEAGLGEDRERLERRWNATAALIAALDQDTVEHVLRIVFHSKAAPSPEVILQLRQVFKKADDLFDMQGNDRELEILCGIILAALLETSGRLPSWAALAVTTSALSGKRTTQLPIDLGASAENAIARIAEENRVRPTLQDARLEIPKLSFDKAKEKLQTTLDVASFGNAFDSAAEATNAAIANIVKNMNAALYATADFVAIQDEELEMLWWVLGERSNGMKMPFSSVPKHASPLVFGLELAKATVYLPGPLSIEGLLTRAGLKRTQKLSIPEAINACENTWLQAFAEEDAASPLTQPIHFAIQRKRETQDDATWVAGWAALCGIDGNSSFSSLALGTLFYRERLLSIFGGRNS
jgi:hypothetical protein